MSSKHRALITLGIDSLLLFVALPFVFELRTEIDSLRIEADNAEAIVTPLPANPPEAEATPPPAVASGRGRTIVQPDTLLKDALAPEEAEPTDPFIAEARRRAEEDPQAAMEWIQSQANGTERLRGMLEVVALWAADDSENALLWLESNAQGIARLETLNSGMTLWSQQDPVAAAQWIDEMANDGSKIAAAKALASNWANVSPTEASQWVSQLPTGTLRYEAGSALLESWTVADPEAAAVWALSEAEFGSGPKLLQLSIEKYVVAAPDEAETFLRNLTQAYEAPEAIETYVRARAKNDPLEAMNWSAALSPDDPLRQPENARIIMQEWSRTDSVAASAWLSESVIGPKRDAAIVGFTSTMLDFEPEAATAWANSISAPETRIEYLSKSINVWSRNQPTEALDWLKSADLNPDLRKQLANEIGAD
jgi:hypothetical protein